MRSHILETAASARLAAAAQTATLQLLSEMVQLHRQTCPHDSDRDAANSAKLKETSEPPPGPPPHLRSQLHSVLSELLRPDLDDPYDQQIHNGLQRGSTQQPHNLQQWQLDAAALPPPGDPRPHDTAGLQDCGAPPGPRPQLLSPLPPAPAASVLAPVATFMASAAAMPPAAGAAGAPSGDWPSWWSWGRESLTEAGLVGEGGNAATSGDGTSGPAGGPPENSNGGDSSRVSGRGAPAAPATRSPRSYDGDSGHEASSARADDLEGGGDRNGGFAPGEAATPPSARPLPASRPPPPPLSVGPHGLTHPMYSPEGYLRRPYALQLAWAAAVWRLTGQFPYPAVRQLRPPLLREGDSYWAALGEVEALLPLLLPQWRPRQPGGGGGEEEPVAGLDGPWAGRQAGGGDGSSGELAHAAVAATASSWTPPRGQTFPPGTAAAAAAGDTAFASASASPAASAAASAATAAAAALPLLLLDARLVYLLLGFRLTAGSATRLVGLPSLRECWQAFERRHAPPGSTSVLTVGARALTKHTHRDLRAEWWPQMTGSEAAKNQLARGSLERLLAGALWLNCHQLPPFEAPKYVLEVRNGQGYGARWAVEDDSDSQDTVAGAAAAVVGLGEEAAAVTAARRARVHFRGFLEPQMEGGHEAGWRH